MRAGQLVKLTTGPPYRPSNGGPPSFSHKFEMASNSLLRHPPDNGEYRERAV